MSIPDHNRQKKIAVINDFSGFGRCSIAVSLPIISAMGIQCCPVPTAVFSDHTGFDSYYRVILLTICAVISESGQSLTSDFPGW